MSPSLAPSTSMNTDTVRWAQRPSLVTGVHRITDANSLEAEALAGEDLPKSILHLDLTHSTDK